jgi:DNA-binding transcriptional LysR family regulator
MELMWLEDFLALARGDSFSRAAETRGVTQPAFSRRIRALEYWLGVTLVDRDTHRIALTPSGVRFVEIADAVLRNLELGRREVQEIAGLSQSTLRFVATHALSLTFFPRWIQNLQARAQQEFAVQLTADNMTAAEQLMLQGRAQFLLGHHHPAAATALDQRHFISITLGQDCLIPVSKGREDGTTPLHALPGHGDSPAPFLDYGAESGMGRIVAAARAAGGPIAELSPVFTSHAVMVLAAMARDGRGLAWLPESLVHDDLRSGALARAGDGEWDIPIEIRLYRPRARQTPAAEGFWKLLRADADPSASELIDAS